MLDACFIFEAKIDRLDQVWHEGPLPIKSATNLADATRRSSYFQPHAAQLLYSTQNRWHVVVDNEAMTDDAVVTGWELVRLPHDPEGALVVLHTLITSSKPVQTISAIALAFASSDYGTDFAILQPPAGVTPLNRRAFTVSCLNFDSVCEEADDMPDYAWTYADKWLWLLASGTPVSQYPPPNGSAPSVTKDAFEVSRSWSACVLRDGASFIFNEPKDEEDKNFQQIARSYVRTIYLDALILGIMQKLGLIYFAVHVAVVLDDPRKPWKITALQEEFSVFRSRVWWQQITARGVANELLRRFQAQHALAPISRQISDELNDYSQHLQSSSAVTTNAFVGLFTMLAVPVAIGVSLPQVTGTIGWAGVIMASVTTAALLGFTLLLRTSRRLINDLRHQLR